ncbi:MAG: exonuclease, partial [Longicatena sp.]
LKIQKQIESKKKQQAHFRKVMQERFKEYPRCIEVEFNQEIFDQFQSWEMKDRYFKWHFKKNFVRLEDIDYPYTTISMKLSIDTNEELPSVTLDLKTEEQDIKKKYVLSYHNATPIENIIRRVGNAHE